MLVSGSVTHTYWSRFGQLQLFNNVVNEYTSVFKQDSTYTLVQRIHQNVIKTGKLHLFAEGLIAPAVCHDGRQSAKNVLKKDNARHRTSHSTRSGVCVCSNEI